MLETLIFGSLQFDEKTVLCTFSALKKRAQETQIEKFFIIHDVDIQIISVHISNFHNNNLKIQMVFENICN